MHRRVLFTAAGMATVATITTSHAATHSTGPGAPADAGRVAATRLATDLGHGRTLAIDLRAAQLATGPILRVVVQRCGPDGACATSAYQSALPADAFTVDPTNAVADLRTTVAGRAVHLRWQPAAESGVVLGGVDDSGTDADQAGSEFAGTPADTTATIGERTCATDGAVGNAVYTDMSKATGGSGVQDLGALRIPARAALTCAAPGKPLAP